MTPRAFQWIAALVVAAALLAPRVSSARASESVVARAIVESDVAGVKRAIAAGGVDWQAPVTAADQTMPLGRLAIEVAAGRLAGVNVRADDPRAIEVARLVFGAGADPNDSWLEYPGEGSPVRHYLVERAIGEDASLVDVVIHAGLDMKSPGVGEALVAASARGWTETVRLLVAKGADVNHAQRGSRRTPLSEAVHLRRLAVIEILERAGAREW
jgi:hypothetical protein